MSVYQTGEIIKISFCDPFWGFTIENERSEQSWSDARIVGHNPGKRDPHRHIETQTEPNKIHRKQPTPEQKAQKKQNNQGTHKHTYREKDKKQQMHPNLKHKEKHNLPYPLRGARRRRRRRWRWGERHVQRQAQLNGKEQRMQQTEEKMSNQKETTRAAISA